ncbi:MAG TPA: tripartite tricarboxylate transporter permease, partial [Aminivibrio sp.]|nr:tripartite tricarboxylate transporter permease [Aminivibrio sp.]
MDELFFQVLEGAFALPVILYTTVGVFLGITVGAIPGLSGDMAIALLLPLIYKVSPAAALGML